MTSQTEQATALSGQEIERLRADTAAIGEVVHFNHAGDSPTPTSILDRIVDHLRLEARIGAYEAAAEMADRIEDTYRSIAGLVNGQPDEIAIVENATRAWDMLAYSLPIQPGDRILTGANEYGSNAIALLQLAKRGATIEVIPDDASGQIDVAALSAMLDDRVRLVAITHMPTNGGLIQPAEAIGRTLRDAGSGAVYLLDACQTVGQTPVDVRAIGCHALSATSRKYLRGPRGRGFLWVDGPLAERLEPPMLDNHAATWTGTDRYELAPGARRFENWEQPTALTLGLGLAVDHAREIGPDRIRATVQPRAEGLRRRLDAIPGVTVRDLGQTRGAIVSFTVDGVRPEDVKAALARDRINVSVSVITSTRYDMERRGLDDIVRASLHYVTTEAECDLLAERVEAIARPG